jgi:hypothetical protein
LSWARRRTGRPLVGSPFSGCTSLLGPVTCIVLEPMAVEPRPDRWPRGVGRALRQGSRPLLVRPDQPDPFASAIVDALAHRKEDVRRSKARRRVREHFNVEKVANQMMPSTALARVMGQSSAHSSSQRDVLIAGVDRSGSAGFSGKPQTRNTCTNPITTSSRPFAPQVKRPLGPFPSLDCGESAPEYEPLWASRLNAATGSGRCGTVSRHRPRAVLPLRRRVP